MQEPILHATHKAIEVIKKCSTKHGLYASAGPLPYTQVWGRDSNITLIGATAHTKEFEGVFRKTLETLASKQSKKGQIPNAVDFVGSIDKPATFATIDSSLWFIFGEHFYKKKFGNSLWKKHAKNIEAAMKWIDFQDAGEDLLPEQQPTSDWMDCFPHKYGHVLNTQALYYAALCATGRKKELKAVKKAINSYLWSEKLGYYLPWRWKDHGKFSEKETWFDSLGNMLAIVFGLATKKQAKRILDFVKRKGIAMPYPMRAIYPPIKKGSPEWKDYYSDSLAGTPNEYLNAGIWPYIGGFYVAALVKAKRFSDAEAALESLAKANSLGKKLDWDFNEWIHPITGEPEGGRFQAWSAGGYLLAYEAVKRKTNPLEI
ncbi:MAG: hypothetical protein NUV67_06135 [archaeon]|nr:hypothetical protein [archaeon]